MPPRCPSLARQRRSLSVGRAPPPVPVVAAEVGNHRRPRSPPTAKRILERQHILKRLGGSRKKAVELSAFPGAHLALAKAAQYRGGYRWRATELSIARLNRHGGYQNRHESLRSGTWLRIRQDRPDVRNCARRQRSRAASRKSGRHRWRQCRFRRALTAAIDQVNQVQQQAHQMAENCRRPDRRQSSGWSIWQLASLSFQQMVQCAQVLVTAHNAIMNMVV